MSRQVANRIVKPILSKTPEEARKGVTALYRNFYRELDWTMRQHMMDVPIAAARKRLKEEFLKNKDITDIRMIDMLVIKGQMTFDEFHNYWMQNYNIYAFFDYTDTQHKKTAEKDNTFLDNFYKSSD